MQENPGPPRHPYGAAYPQPQYPYPPVPPQRSWFLPMPHGARFDHLARNEATRAWRSIVGTLVIALGFFLIGFIVITAAMLFAAVFGLPSPVDVNTGLPTGTPFGLGTTLMSIAPVLLLVVGVTALVQRRRPGTLSSVAGRLRWGWMARCAGLAVLAMVLGQAAQWLALTLSGAEAGMGGWVGWEAFLPVFVVILVLVPFQAAAEEYVFRGWFLQAVGAHVRNPVPGIVIGAALFASLHGYSWTGLADVFAFGVVMGWLSVRTGGLEAAVALHVLNNLVAFGLSAAAGQLQESLNQAAVAVPWQALTGTAVQFLVFSVGVLYLAKKRSIATISQ